MEKSVGRKWGGTCRDINPVTPVFPAEWVISHLPKGKEGGEEISYGQEEL